MSVTTLLPDSDLALTTATGQPNPGAPFVQLQSDAIVGAHIAALGLSSNILSDIEKLITLNDPLLVRLGYTIGIAGRAYAAAARKSVGWYATIAVHNSAIDSNWDGGSKADPYGHPNAPA